MYRALLVFLFLLNVQTLMFAQIRTPEKRKFNIGLFDGIGGVNYAPIPALDLSYKSTTLRLAPAYRVNSIGVCQEILKISEVYYNWFWIGSAFYSIGNEDDIYGGGPGVTITSDFKRAIGLTGVKVYFGKRFYSQIQGGVMNEKYTTDGYPDKLKTTPYFEFGLGIQLFKSFHDIPLFE